MAKKTKKSRPTADPSSSALKSLVHSQSLFFDRLVELIPARFYLPTDDAEKPWFQGLSKAARASSKKESRENLRRARRERLNPEKATSTLEILKKTISDGKEENGGEGDEVEEDRALTYEDLRLRLRKRIEALRSNRNTRTEEREKDGKKKKRKRDEKVKDEEEEDAVDEKEEEKKGGNDDPSVVDLSFGHVKINDREKKRKKKAISKEEELARAQRLQEAKKDPERGEVVAKKHSWKAAVSRAAGEKVHDDPKLLKESMRKEKTRRKKNTEKWKDRKDTVEKARAEKQKKRAENIGEKKQQKKARKIAKREKKLMNPGRSSSRTEG